MRYGSLSPFLRPQVLFTTNEPQSYVFGGRNHPLHINSQKKILEKYCRDHGYTAIRHYDEDDGYSGTNFNRPGFQRMLADIKAGKIKRVVVKDDCVIIELNAESPIKCGFCAVGSIF